MGFRRTLLWVFVFSLALTAVLGVTALLLPDIPFEGELLLSSFLLTVHSLAGLVCAGVIAKRKLVVFAWIGTGMFTWSLLGWLFLVWADPHGNAEDFVVKSSASASILGVVTIHAVLLMFAGLRRNLGRMVRWITLVCAAVLGLWALTVIWGGFDEPDEFVGRLMGALAIVGSLGTIATPILWRLERLDQEEQGDTAMIGSVPVSLECPRCAHKLSVAGNKQRRCEGCGLKIFVRFEEPRCMCGYLLLGLTGDTCPECGRLIPEADHWGARTDADA